jgi:hypothetical protein
MFLNAVSTDAKYFIIILKFFLKIRLEPNPKTKQYVAF